MCSAFGQSFIYLALLEFGSLVLSVVTTVRKFFSILFSIVWFRHPISFAQWIGIGLVFMGLFVLPYGKVLLEKFTVKHYVKEKVEDDKKKS